jgi:hypothetical protein
VSQDLAPNLVDILAPAATPLAIVFVGLVIWHQLRKDVHPIFVNIVKGLSVNAQSNAMYFAMLILCGLNAGSPALATAAQKFHWPLTEAVASIASASFSAILAFMIKPPPTSFTPPEIKTTVVPETPKTP